MACPHCRARIFRNCNSRWPNSKIWASNREPVLPMEFDTSKYLRAAMSEVDTALTEEEKSKVGWRGSTLELAYFLGTK